MNISSVSSMPIQAPQPVQQAPQINDHDSDDGAAVSAPVTQAPAAPGTGLVTDKVA